MNYPLISEYVEAIKSAEDNFNELTYLRPVLGDDGQPIMTSGNFAVVFKMEDVETGKLYALKCFTKEQEGRGEAYQQIIEGLHYVDSHYLIPIRYLNNELFVDTDQTPEMEFPVLLMDWVEGKALDTYLLQIINDPFSLKELACHFFLLAQWLISQPFAHGDLKPDNILVHEDGSLILVDYDGMYMPAMKGQRARELGSPNFRHPQRTEDDFDEHIDDLPIVSILLSLCTAYVNATLCFLIGKTLTPNILFFCEKDYRTIHETSTLKRVPQIIIETTNYTIILQQLCDSKINNLTCLQISSIENLVDRVDKYVEDYYRQLFPFRKEPQPEDSKHAEPISVKQVPAKLDCSNNNSTKWQSALLLHVFTVFVAYLNYYNNDLVIVNEMWSYLGWGFGIGFIAWLFPFFDYVKRDGSIGNCLIAFLLFPITMYYGVYRFFYACINLLKEWYKYHDYN